MSSSSKKSSNGDKYILDPAQNPVINTPYEKTRHHWAISETNRAVNELRTDRRPSMRLLPVPKPDASDQQILVAEKDMLNRAVNDIRDEVDKWRISGYQGVTRATLDLLNHWRRKDHDRRLFYAQIEALETLVWLTEVADKNKQGRTLKQRVVAASKDKNDGLLRYAVKMATGTGKTVVMAMLILWHAVNASPRDDRFYTRFLVIAPGLTVRDRLQVLVPQDLDNKRTFWDEFNLIPDERARQKLAKVRVAVRNFQAFQRRDWLGSYATGDTKRLLRGSATKELERSKTMMSRVLRGMFNHRSHTKMPICVINDEAHHCYLPIKKERTGAEKGDDQQAALWFNALRTLKKEGAATGPIYDFSATPMFISTAAKKNGAEMFPWVVSDYPLMDAIEAGLVKVPRVPVADNTAGRSVNWRNIWEATPKRSRKLKREQLPYTLEGALEALYDNYEKTFEKWQKMPTPPVFILVANSVANAEALYQHLSGWESDSGGGNVLGKKELFSNYVQNDDGEVVPGRVRTLLVHSKIEAEGNISGAIGAAIRRQANLLREEGAVGDDKEVMRAALNSIGEPGGVGEQIRCVVSVSMLTEGWDTRTVTHILGFRAFSTQLLCEQVTGRALRRPSYDNFDKTRHDGQYLDVEFAEVLGVPYDFMPSSDDTSEPKTPASRYDVFSVNDKADHRVQFPALRSYKLSRPKRGAFIDLDAVGRYKPPSVAESAVIKGVVGKEEHIATLGADCRVQEVKAHLAADLTDLLEKEVMTQADKLLVTEREKDDGKHVATADRLKLFRDSYVAVEKWSAHENVNLSDDEFRKLRYPDIRKKPASMIFEACLYTDARAKPDVVGLFERQPYNDTADVSFETTLTNRHPDKNSDITLARSELNIAACHSKFEVETAKLLDNHPDVQGWARNFKLGWEVPYMLDGVWHRYVPDFVVRLFGGLGDANAVNLIVECKGMPDKVSEKKHQFLRKWWIPAVANAGDELPAHLLRWDFVEFRSLENLSADLEFAIRNARELQPAPVLETQKF